MNSYVSPDLEKIEDYAPSCSDEVKISIYNDKWCTKKDEEMTKTWDDKYKEAMKDKGKCKQVEDNSYRYVCNNKNMKKTTFNGQDCMGKALMTYVYQWKKCTEFDGAGNYIWIESAQALSSAAAGVALALFAYQY